MIIATIIPIATFQSTEEPMPMQKVPVLVRQVSHRTRKEIIHKLVFIILTKILFMDLIRTQKEVIPRLSEKQLMQKDCILYLEVMLHMQKVVAQKQLEYLHTQKVVAQKQLEYLHTQKAYQL